MRPSINDVTKLIVALGFVLFGCGALVLVAKHQPEVHASAPRTAMGGSGDVGWTIAVTPNNTVYALSWNTSTGESRMYWGSPAAKWERAESELPKNPFK
jgi:hypothetical protein